jgi:CDP-glycerol glycerophosphotransferase (TagB/SpsB family)
MSKLKKLITLLVKLFIFGCAHLVPKQKNLWVFGAWFGQRYSDNPKAFFEYINENQKHIKAVWITKDKRIAQQLTQEGHLAYLENSIKGLLIQLRAEFAFVCQSIHDDLYPACISKNTKVVNLWHGLPLKKIMYDVFADKTINKNMVGMLFDFLSPYEKIRNDYLLATSIETQNTLSKAFRLPKNRTLITGFPRNDVFLPKAITTYETLDKPYKCIYMPTFRGGIGTECDLFSKYGFDFDMVEGLLNKNNIELTLRMHPVNLPPKSLVRKIQHSTNICLDSGGDIYQSISIYDCLITDYSSIYFDFLLGEKPIIFAPFDLIVYKQKERSLYFEFEEVTLKPYCYSWEQVIQRVIELKNDGISDKYKEQYQYLKNRFHDEEINIGSSFSERLYTKLMINR